MFITLSNGLATIITLTPTTENIVELSCYTVIFTLLVGLPMIEIPNFIPKL